MTGQLMSKYIKIDEGLRLLASGYSVMVIDEGKIPLMYDEVEGKKVKTWKALQENPVTDNQLKEACMNPEAWRFGYACGYNDVFVIDIDLKVLLPEYRKEFWNEFLDFVKDNIDGFEKKCAVYRTLNFGYHIVYRTRTTMGNTKLAVPRRNTVNDDNKQAVIETRGIGGYAVFYDESITEANYHSVERLSQEEHDCLIGICKYFDERVLDEPVQTPKKTYAEFKQTGLTPWEDYNRRHTVYDVIGDEFKLVRKLASRDIIKRHGATSAHSGYVYKDSGCMYLFSTGTSYPHETLLSPFSLYTYKYHNGDFSSAGKQAYADGYGDRVKSKMPDVPPIPVEEIKRLEFPIEIFPERVQKYIIECHRTLDNSVDYMGVSMLWMMCVMIGNSLKVMVKSGWIEPAIVWVAIIGKAGIGKSPSISSIIRPLIKENSREVKEYQRQYAKFKLYDALNPKDKKNAIEVPEPTKKQFIVNDITLEALVELHEENKNSVGVFKDELAGWIKDMNKYRQGGDLEQWLSSFNNLPIMLNRKSVKSNYVHSPIIPVLGGIQPTVLSQVATQDYKDNGFLDRMLLCFPEIEIQEYNEKEMHYDIINWYNDYILTLHSHIMNDVIKVDEDMEVKATVVGLEKGAKEEWIRIFNKITHMQRSDEETEYTKSMLPKQKSYIPRFALLLNVLEAYDNGEVITCEISRESMLKAEKLSDYFITMAKKVKVDSVQYSQMRSIVSDKRNASEFEKFEALFRINPNVNRTEIASELNVSRRTVQGWIKQIQEHEKTA